MQLHDRQADGVGALGRAGGEDAVGTLVQEGEHGQVLALDLVQVVEDDEVGEARDVAQPLDEFGQDADHALAAARAGGLDGHALHALVGGVEIADGFVMDVHVSTFDVVQYL